MRNIPRSLEAEAVGRDPLAARPAMVEAAKKLRRSYDVFFLTLAVAMVFWPGWSWAEEVKPSTLALAAAGVADGVTTERFLAIDGQQRLVWDPANGCKCMLSEGHFRELNPLVRNRAVRWAVGSAEVVGVHYLTKKKPRLGKIVGYALATVHASLAVYNHVSTERYVARWERAGRP